MTITGVYTVGIRKSTKRMEEPIDVKFVTTEMLTIVEEESLERTMSEKCSGRGYVDSYGNI